MPGRSGKAVARRAPGRAPEGRVLLVEGYGVEGDAHAGAFVKHRYLARRQPRLANLRQVHLIPSELFEALRLEGYGVGPGELGENMTTIGLELERMPLRTLIQLGPSAVVELTGLRTPCVLIDRFRTGLKRPRALVGGDGSTVQVRGDGDGQSRWTSRCWRSGAGIDAGGAPDVPSAPVAVCKKSGSDERFGVPPVDADTHGRKQGNGDTPGAGETLAGGRVVQRVVVAGQT